MPKSFFWYELMTSDTKAATDFYTAVVGWRPEAFDNNMGYTVLNAGDRGVGGIMNLPPDAPGLPPCWVGYIHSRDVDADVSSLQEAGVSVHKAPADIPGVGRFAVVADPHGAMFMLMRPNGPDMAPAPLNTPGHIGWHELYAGDGKAAFDFYASQFGWTKGEAFDMGPMGVYQLFAAGGEDIGGIMTKPPAMPTPAWGFYFNVDSASAAVQRITDKGGQVVMGPQEVPGGGWIVQGIDPQGARFAVVAPVK